VDLFERHEISPVYYSAPPQPNFVVLAFGRVRVVAIAPRLSELTVLALDPEFCILIASDVTSVANCFALSIEALCETLIAFTANAPSIAIFYDILVFA